MLTNSQRFMNKHAKKGILLATLFVMGACNPLDSLYKEIRRFGYIEYKTPLEHTGTGTIIGGSPQSFSIIAPPQECFPFQDDSGPTYLRTIDATSLPSKARKISVKADVSVGILKLAETSKGTIDVGLGFSNVTSIELEMTDATVEYFSAPKITRYYQENMDDICKQYLDIGGFIYQALRVGKLKYSFYNKNGTRIELTMDKVTEILNIGADIGYTVENGAKLVFDGPRFVGFQLGRLRKEDQGVGLYRATKTKNNKWVWEPLNIFDHHSVLPVALRPKREKADVSDVESIDNFSLFR